MMKQHKIVYTVLLMICIFLLNSASALLVTYEGSVVTTHETFSLAVSGQVVTVASEYTLVNRGGGAETVELSFPGFPKNAVVTSNGSAFTGKLTLQPREQRSIRAHYTVSLAHGTRAFTFSPEMLLNGYADDHRIGNIEGAISFAEAGNTLQTIEGFRDRGIVDGKHVYQYQATNVYQPSFSLRWLVNDPHLEVVRTHSTVSNVGDILVMSVSVTNRGDQYLKDVKLSDSFLQSTYEPLSPASAFRAIESEVEAPYVWEHTIAELAPGASEHVEYSVRVTQMGNLRTLPLTVFVDGQLVASVDGEFLAQATGPTEEHLAYATSDTVTVPGSIVPNLTQSAPRLPLRAPVLFSSSHSWLVWLLLVVVLSVIGYLIAPYLKAFLRAHRTGEQNAGKYYSSGGLR